MMDEDLVFLILVLFLHISLYGEAGTEKIFGLSYLYLDN